MIFGEESRVVKVSSRLSTCALDWNRIRAEDQIEGAPAREGSEELEKAIKELARNKEVAQLYQKLAGQIRCQRGKRIRKSSLAAFESPVLQLQTNGTGNESRLV